MKTKLISTLVAGLIVISPATYANYFKDDFSWGFDRLFGVHVVAIMAHLLAANLSQE